MDYLGENIYAEGVKRTLGWGPCDTCAIYKEEVFLGHAHIADEISSSAEEIGSTEELYKQFDKAIIRAVLAGEISLEKDFYYQGKVPKSYDIPY